MKSIMLGDVFTTAQLEHAQRLYSDPQNHVPAVELILQYVTEPALAQINDRTGQLNDARYWAYAIVYAIEQGNR